MRFGRYSTRNFIIIYRYGPNTMDFLWRGISHMPYFHWALISNFLKKYEVDQTSLSKPKFDSTESFYGGLSKQYLFKRQLKNGVCVTFSKK